MTNNMTRLTLQSTASRDHTLSRSAVHAPIVFGTGLIALDLILGTDSVRPPILAAGGTCGNVLAVLSFLGWEAFPVARLNDDVASEIVRADLGRWNVALDFAMQAPGAATPIIIQRNQRSPNGQPRHRFSIVCPACGAWFPSFRAVTTDGAQEVIDAVEGALPSGFAPRVFFFDRVSRGALMLAKAFSERGAVVVFEPAGFGDPKLFEEALSVAHVLKYSNERLPALAARRKGARQFLLEIETLGDAGLRYRSHLLKSPSWSHLDAVPAPTLVDTSGAGDWCTAGFLAMLATDGIAGVENARARDIAQALRFGQASAAMACGYEGARGAMNAIDRKKFDRAVAALIAGKRLTSNTASSISDNQLADQSKSERRHAVKAISRVAIGDVCPACT